MTDIHCHLIHDVDDGARTIEESVELIKKLNDLGFDKIIITPHFIYGTEYTCENKIKTEKLSAIKSELIKQNINVELHLGNEIFINKTIDKFLEDGMASSLAGTKYLLIELPFQNKILGFKDILYELTCKGYIPIIAHPERYLYFQEDYSQVDELKEEGILFQCNYASVLGYYGKSSEKLVKYMLKNNYVDYFGTDTHRTDKTYLFDNFKKIEKQIIKKIGQEKYQEILNNSNQIISD